MVLRGEFKNELGLILQKDKNKEEVTVQLDENSGLQIINIKMDDVCMIV